MKWVDLKIFYDYKVVPQIVGKQGCILFLNVNAMYKQGFTLLH